MNVDEVATLMTTIIRKSGHIFRHALTCEGELESIAGMVDGHALGACRAIGYILHVLTQTDDRPAGKFLDMFNGSDWEARSRFLQYRPTIGRSIMETFVISLDRIRQHKEDALRLLNLLGFLNSKDRSLDFRDFLRPRRPWLTELQSKLPDYDLFAKGLVGQGECLSELENVSLGVRPDVSSPLHIHPLWLECIQQRVGLESRVRWIRQILIICHGSHGLGTNRNRSTLYFRLQAMPCGLLLTLVSDPASSLNPRSSKIGLNPSMNLSKIPYIPLIPRVVMLTMRMKPPLSLLPLLPLLKNWRVFKTIVSRQRKPLHP